jgi:threonine dehydrogenase-like Zn-dependent dehydrogenase
MRQLTLLAPGEVEWIDVEEPVLHDIRDALVRPLAVGVCDVDPLLIAGAVPASYPIALGHEFIAEVVQAGPAAAVNVGDRVVAPYQVSCGDCEACRRGRTGHCDSVPTRSLFGFGEVGGGWGGALSDLLRVPFGDHMLRVLPPGVDPAACAALSDNIADGYRAVAPGLAEFPRAPVLNVADAGSIPLYAAALAVALGASEVDFLCADEATCAIAQRLGAAVASGPPPSSAAYPVTVAATWDPDGLARALRSTARGGRCTNVAPMRSARLPVLYMFENDVTLVTGRGHPGAVLDDILRLIADGRFDPGLVLCRTASWNEAADVLQGGVGKGVILRDELL